jgi:hypothetical protein
MQILSAAAANPNGVITLIPHNPQLPAIYYVDGLNPIQWSWSVSNQNWMYSQSGGIQGVPYTLGTPTNPAVLTGQAIAYDPTGSLDTQFWNVSTQTWH